MRWDEPAALSRDTDVRGVWHSWTYYVWCFIANVRAVFVLLREKLCPRTKRQCPFVQCDIKASTVARGETVRKLPCHRERKQNHKKEKKKKTKKIKKDKTKKKKQNHTQQQKKPHQKKQKKTEAGNRRAALQDWPSRGGWCWPPPWILPVGTGAFRQGRPECYLPALLGTGTERVGEARGPGSHRLDWVCLGTSWWPYVEFLFSYLFLFFFPFLLFFYTMK